MTPDQDDDVLKLRAYDQPDASGQILDSIQIEMPDVPSAQNSFSFKLLSVGDNDGCIKSISMIGGSETYPNSVFYDNIIVGEPCLVY